MIGLLIVSHLLSVFPRVGQFAGPTARIDGDVLLSLERHMLTARITYNYIAVDTGQRDIRFYLNGEFQLTSLTCGVCKSYTLTARRSHCRPSL
jgi:hypothetical protein